MFIGAAKSQYGHAETGAGAIGLLGAMTALSQGSHSALLHLRSLNPYIVDSLDMAHKQGTLAALLRGVPVFVASFILSRRPALATVMTAYCMLRHTWSSLTSYDTHDIPTLLMLQHAMQAERPSS